MRSGRETTTTRHGYQGAGVCRISRFGIRVCLVSRGSRPGAGLDQDLSIQLTRDPWDAVVSWPLGPRSMHSFNALAGAAQWACRSSAAERLAPELLVKLAHDHHGAGVLAAARRGVNARERVWPVLAWSQLVHVRLSDGRFGIAGGNLPPGAGQAQCSSSKVMECE